MSLRTKNTQINILTKNTVLEAINILLSCGYIKEIMCYGASIMTWILGITYWPYKLAIKYNLSIKRTERKSD